MPFKGGAPDVLLFCGSRGANRFGGLRVWLIVRVSKRMHGFLQKWKVVLEVTKIMKSHGNVLLMNTIGPVVGF